jgi:subtilisin-like proprotein convertase family protein
MACTGEYAARFGGTTAGALAAIVTSVNRVSGVYNTELAVRFQLVPKTDTLIFLNAATDPYTNLSNGAALNTNQTVVDARIGNANYDIGHLFNTADGGVAQRPSICLTGSKARGSTGLPNPQGDAFDIDYVAHELGHQFGGNHTFNYDASGSCAGGNRASTAAYEPGGGTTIMAYAGICGAGNLQSNSDPYFHAKSLEEIQNTITSTGTCAVVTATGNNPPVVNAGQTYIIPIGTPFELTGSATDPDGDPLTYAWEEYDLGPAGVPNSPTGNAPLFRSFSPTPSPTRTFPATLRIVNGATVAGPLLTNTPVLGEILPTYARFLRFRLTARDNKAVGGGVDYAATNLTVSDVGGPFLVTAPNTSSVIWRVGVPQRVSWNVANTTAAPISAANVDIMLSVDGGRTFPYTLLAGTPNDGDQQVTLPTTLTATSQARIKVKASGNVFFDLSNQDFQIQVPTSPAFYVNSTCAGSSISICPGTSGTCSIEVGQLLGFTGSVALTATGLPTGATATFAPSTTAAGTTTTLTVAAGANTPSGSYPVTVTGTSGSITDSQQIMVVIRNSANVPPTLLAPAANTLRAATLPTFTWSAITGATYDLEVSTSSTFAAGSTVLTQTGLTTTSYTVTTPLTPNTRYYWRVRGNAECGVGPYQSGVFAVGQQVCTSFAATGLPVTIGTGANAVATSTITLTSTDPIQQLNVRNLSITHPDVFELAVKLIGPNGSTESALYTNTCSGANLSGNFSDAAAGPIACPATGTGTYKPLTPLSVFNNTPANGTWTLQVTDLLAGNGGTINSWSLELCTIGDAVLATRNVQQLQGVTVFPNPSTGQFEVVVNNAQTGKLSVHVTDAVGRLVLAEEVSKGAGQLQHRLDLSKLSQGVYQLRLDLPGGGTAVQKLMKL